MRRDWIISTGVHAVVVILSLVTLASSNPSMTMTDYMPVDIVTADNESHITAGVKNAPKPKIELPKPLADKIDVPKPADQTADKVGKQDIKTETAPPKQQQQPDPKPAEKQAQPLPDAKPADKQAKPKAPDYKPDQIAQLLKKDTVKPQPQDKPAPDKSAKDAPKFDANQVAALLDHREPQRQIASADTVNNKPTLGAATGASAQLSLDEINWLKQRISSCWSPPPGINAETKVKVSIRALLRQDGSLAQPPVLVEATPSALGPALAESAIRAILSCQPFNKLLPEHYQQWRDMTLDFDPQTLLGG